MNLQEPSPASRSWLGNPPPPPPTPLLPRAGPVGHIPQLCWVPNTCSWCPSILMYEVERLLLALHESRLGDATLDIPGHRDSLWPHLGST